MEITIAPVKRRNLPTLVALQRAAFAPLYALYQDEGSSYQRGKDEILRWMKHPAQYPYKILADGEICGGITAYARGNGEYYLARIYVSPAMQRNGIASQAIALLEAKFPDACKWTLDFPADQPANRRCYEKAGYYDTETLEQRNEKLTLALYEKNT